jgi:hypothetical protein
LFVHDDEIEEVKEEEETGVAEFIVVGREKRPRL